MKFAVGLGLCFLLCFATVQGLTVEELKETFKAARTKCQGDPATAVDEEAVKIYLRSKGQGEKPANLGPHTLCMSKTIGLQNADGSINKEHLRERISARVQDAAKVDEIVNECAVQQKDEIANARLLFKCFMKYAREEHN